MLRLNVGVQISKPLGSYLFVRLGLKDIKEYHISKSFAKKNSNFDEFFLFF